MFICKFLSKLQENYKLIASKFDEESYIKALDRTLTEFAPEECQVYGCILELKVALAKVCVKPLSKEIVSKLYARDFARMRKKDVNEIAEHLKNESPSEQEISEIIDHRDDNAVLSVISHYFKGDKRIISKVNEITEALKNEPSLTDKTETGELHKTIKKIQDIEKVEEQKEQQVMKVQEEDNSLYDEMLANTEKMNARRESMRPMS